MSSEPAKTFWDLLFRIFGILMLVGAWQLISLSFSGLVVASPVESLAAALALIRDNDFMCRHFWVSLTRMGLALGGGVLVGGTLGVASGIFPGVRSLVEPLRWMLMTVPGVVIVVVFMLWFGMGSLMVVSIAGSMGAPIIFVNVADAMSRVDKNLMEMAQVYRFNLKTRLMRIYAMAVAGPFFSALAIAAGNIIRVVVLAEVLGANEGIGYCLAIARTRLDTPALYGLALISMSVAGGMEFFIFRPLERCLTGGWK